MEGSPHLLLLYRLDHLHPQVVDGLHLGGLHGELALMDDRKKAGASTTSSTGPRGQQDMPLMPSCSPQPCRAMLLAGLMW
jgi:hypothetical protein